MIFTQGRLASSIPRPYDINKTTRHERISSLDKIPVCLSNWNELNLSLLVFIIGLIGSYWSNIQLVGAVNPWKQYLKTCLSKNAKPRNLSPQAESETRLHICLKATPQVSMKLGSRLRPLDVILTWDLETWKPRLIVKIDGSDWCVINGIDMGEITQSGRVRSIYPRKLTWIPKIAIFERSTLKKHDFWYLCWISGKYLSIINILTVYQTWMLKQKTKSSSLETMTRHCRFSALLNEILSSPVLSTKRSNWLKPLNHEFPPTIIYPPGN